MKIYTKTGDAGTTSLVGGKRVSKTAPRLEAYGTVDELNSHIGLLISLLPATDALSDSSENSDSSDNSEYPLLRSFLINIQSRLFDLGAYLATEPKDDSPTSTPPQGITPDEISALETEIDRITAPLPPLTSFILPGGTTPACQAHVCRTVCRRAERHTLAISPLPNHLAIAYLNRLSDYLFTLARYLNHLADTPEIPWRP